MKVLLRWPIWFAAILLLLLHGFVLIAQVDLSFSHPSGIYSKLTLIQIKSDVPDLDIRYTLNGDLPGPNDLQYTRPFIFTQSGAVNGGLSLIPTTPVLENLYYKWNEPAQIKRAAYVVRAAAFQNGQLVSNIISGFYKIVPAKAIKPKIPIVSIITDSVHFFGHETGIYVPGIKFEASGNPDNGNYYHSGEAWERPAHFTYIDTDGDVKINQQIDVRIHGGYTRRFPVKTLRLYAKDSYGSGTFQHKFFENNSKDEFKRLLLRNSGQDFNKSYFGDAMMAHIAGGGNLDIQSHTAVVVYINGEYWGVHNLRERIDKYYLKSFHNLHVDRTDLIKFDNQFELEEGDWNAFYHIWDLITHADLSDHAVYEEFAAWVDIDNVIDHYAYKIFFGVHDWGSTNVRIWRPKITGGKFRWLFFDNDGGFQNLYYDGFEHALAEDGPAWPNPEWATRMFRNLMNNMEFRTQFLNRMAYLLNNHFCEENLIAVVDSFEQMYENNMPDHINRWAYPKDMQAWRNSVAALREFARYRHVEVRYQMIERFAYQFQNTCLPEEPDENEPTIEGWIYPNPSIDQFSIYAQVINDSPVDISLYDINGRLIDYYPEMKPEERQVHLKIEGIPSGVYIIRLIQHDKLFVKRILIMD